MKRLIASILSAVAIVALSDGIHIGTGATASPDSAIAIGDGAHATGAGVVAIGNGTTATAGVSLGGFQLFDASGNIPAARLANAPAPSITWNTAAKGANPSESLSVASGTFYRRTGSGTYTFTSISGLGPSPTYFVLSGFSSLVLPAGFANAGSGIFRPNRQNHFVAWNAGTTNCVNFLFALP